jgi:hypothetical protein
MMNDEKGGGTSVFFVLPFALASSFIILPSTFPFWCAAKRTVPKARGVGQGGAVERTICLDVHDW